MSKLAQYMHSLWYSLPVGLLLWPQLALAQLENVDAPEGTVSTELPEALLSLVNGFLILIGIVAAIILIIGGVQYIISRGDDQATSKAKSTILYAVIGLIVVGLAAAIVNFVIDAVGAA